MKTSQMAPHPNSHQLVRYGCAKMKKKLGEIREPDRDMRARQAE
jgi:hypothetical protein